MSPIESGPRGMKRFVSEMRIEAPVEVVWDFYSNPHNLPRITLPHLHLRVLHADVPMSKGSRITFGVRRGPVAVTWESVITEYEPMRLFADRQIRGPFGHWLHRHEFESVDGGTRIRDTVEMSPAHGLVGRMASLFLDHEMHELFRYRERMTRAILTKPAGS